METIRIPVIQEQLHIGKRLEETGKVRITKTVSQEEQTVDVSLLKQEVGVEKIPVNKYVEGAIPEIRYEGNTMIIPVVKEVLVVEKRLLLVEEIRVSRHEVETHESKTYLLQREEVRIDRIESSPGGETTK